MTRNAVRQLAGSRFRHGRRFEPGQQRRPVVQQGRVAAQRGHRGALIAAQAHRALAQKSASGGGPSGGIERVFDIGPEQRARGTALGNRGPARRQRLRIVRGNYFDLGRRGFRIDRQRAAFHVCHRAAVAGGLGGQQLLELLEPGALREAASAAGGVPWSRHRRHGRQRAHPGAQVQPAQQPDEADQVAPRAGAAGEIEIARLQAGASSTEWKTPPCARRCSSARPARAPTACAGRDSKGTRRPARNSGAGAAAAPARRTAPAGRGHQQRGYRRQRAHRPAAHQNCRAFRTR